MLLDISLHYTVLEQHDITLYFQLGILFIFHQSLYVQHIVITKLQAYHLQCDSGITVELEYLGGTWIVYRKEWTKQNMLATVWPGRNILPSTGPLDKHDRQGWNAVSKYALPITLHRKRKLTTLRHERLRDVDISRMNIQIPSPHMG